MTIVFFRNKKFVSGFPRTVAQAESLGSKQQLDVVINLDVPFATIKDRISVSVPSPMLDSQQSFIVSYHIHASEWCERQYEISVTTWNVVFDCP